jgi:hypothetical protein
MDTDSYRNEYKTTNFYGFMKRYLDFFDTFVYIKGYEIYNDKNE